MRYSGSKFTVILQCYIVTGNRIELVYVFHANHPIESLCCEEMLAAENYDRRVIEVDLCV